MCIWLGLLRIPVLNSNILEWMFKDSPACVWKFVESDDKIRVIWHAGDVGNVISWVCMILEMWDVGDVGCCGYGMFRIWDFGMCDVQVVECSGCGMLGMWDIQYAGYSRCGMLGMWDVPDVGCLGCGMWDVGCWFTKCRFGICVTVFIIIFITVFPVRSLEPKMQGNDQQVFYCKHISKDVFTFLHFFWMGI